MEPHATSEGTSAVPTKTPPSSRDARLRKFFDFFDLDRDGDITHDDLLAMAARIAAAFDVPPGSPKDVALTNAFQGFWHELLKSLDIDGDRRINDREYRDGMIAAFATSGGFEHGLRQLIKAAVEVADTDGNGTLEPAEFRRLEEAIGNPAEDSEEAFAKLDTDNDGSLTVEELLDAARQFHTGTDLDALGNWLFGSL
ncbi:Calerythrin [Amycolatopsis sp. CA-230715]|nr:Calerythrin [Amycolatopsis sp. CA-230715]